MKYMNKTICLLAAVVLAGCAAPGGGKISSQPKTAAPPCAAQTATHYEHQVVTVYSDGATPFLRLVKVSDP
jgi:uncharacterized lipoprotein YajG